MKQQYWKRCIAGVLFLSIGLISFVLAYMEFRDNAWNFEVCFYGSILPLLIGILYLIPWSKFECLNDLRAVLFGFLYAGICSLILTFGLNVLGLSLNGGFRTYPYEYPFFCIGFVVLCFVLTGVFCLDIAKFKFKPVLPRIAGAVAAFVPFFYLFVFLGNLVN